MTTERLARVAHLTISLFSISLFIDNELNSFLKIYFHGFQNVHLSFLSQIYNNYGNFFNKLYFAATEMKLR